MELGTWLLLACPSAGSFLPDFPVRSGWRFWVGGQRGACRGGASCLLSHHPGQPQNEWLHSILPPRQGCRVPWASCPMPACPQGCGQRDIGAQLGPRWGAPSRFPPDSPPGRGAQVVLRLGLQVSECLGLVSIGCRTEHVGGGRPLGALAGWVGPAGSGGAPARR